MPTKIRREMTIMVSSPNPRRFATIASMSFIFSPILLILSFNPSIP
jgi:hypothetical protein